MNGERSGSGEETGYGWWQSSVGWDVFRNEGTISLLIVRCGIVDYSV